MKEKISYEEMKKITKKVWLTTDDLQKLLCISRKETLRIKKEIKTFIVEQGYYIPYTLLPTKETLDYLKIKEK